MGCLPVHHRVIPSIEFPGTYLNTWEIHYGLGVVSMVTTQCQIWTIQSVSTSLCIPTLDPRFLYTLSYISMLSYCSKLAVKWSSHETKIIVSSICPGWWSVFKGTFTNCFSFTGNVVAKRVFFFWTDPLLLFKLSGRYTCRCLKTKRQWSLNKLKVICYKIKKHRRL